METAPKISVLMSVYNGEQYLREAIDSILSQTYSDFEFIIVNDASTDDSRNIVTEYNDRRIVLVDNEKNIGLTASLNKAIGMAKGEFVARMDADDISLANRFSEQITFMDKHPGVDICACFVQCFGAMDQIWEAPTVHDKIRATLIFHTPIYHPTVMLRRNVFDDGNRYNENYKRSQDFQLWARLAEYYRFAVLPSPLVKYRIHDSQVSRTQVGTRTDAADNIRCEILQNLIDNYSEEELNIHNKIGRNDLVFDNLPKVRDWLNKLAMANEQKQVYEHYSFVEVLTEKWLDICYVNRSYGTFFKSVFKCSTGISKKHIIKKLIAKAHSK